MHQDYHGKSMTPRLFYDPFANLNQRTEDDNCDYDEHFQQVYFDDPNVIEEYEQMKYAYLGCLELVRNPARCTQIFQICGRRWSAMFHMQKRNWPASLFYSL
jgi:hypothetical protein